MMRFLVAALLLTGIIACKSDKKLPILGERLPVQRTDNGQQVIDTIYHSIPDFKLTNQDSVIIDQNTVKDKVYVADFFFTSCPTICPKVRKNLKKVAAHYQNNPQVLLLSHSIDTKYDTVGRLAWYAKKLDIDSRQWHLLTGDKPQIYQLAGDYLISAVEDAQAEGGFDHGSYVALVDKKRHIRGLYDGLDADRIQVLIQDIDRLLKEGE